MCINRCKKRGTLAFKLLKVMSTLNSFGIGTCACFVTLVWLSLVFSLCPQLCSTSAVGEIFLEELSTRQALGGFQTLEDSHSDMDAVSAEQKYDSIDVTKLFLESTIVRGEQIVYAEEGSSSEVEHDFLQRLDHEVDGEGGDTKTSSSHDSDEEMKIQHISRSLLQEDFGEADALLEFKAGIENWTENALDGWTTSNRSNYCSWTRVTCNDQRRVISLNFSSLQMNGSLGPSLGKLMLLEDLDLSHNYLLGSKLPPEWGALQRLQTLSLEDNHLYGGIPAEYGNMSSLRVFNLGYQGWFFNGSIPEELGLLSNLEVLALGTVFNFGFVQDYHPYRSNKMTGRIPASIGNCTKLWYLDFYGNNNLTGPIPLEYGNLVNLEYLSFEQNNFSGFIPSELGNLTKLIFLHFGNNFLEGEVPVSLAGLSALLFLNVGTNFLTGNFIGVNSTSWQLQVLLIDGNNFTGGFPPVLTTLTNLVQLFMFNNMFNGSLPDNIGMLSNLQSFRFRSNQFQGELPESFNNLTQLTTLDAGNNQLNGTLHPIRNLSLLSYLNLGNAYSSKKTTWESLRGFDPNTVVNSFTGPLTDEVILQWPEIRILYLDSNDFYGFIPKALGNLDLEHLLLNDNRFEGTIPEEFGTLLNLELLYLQNNKLTGTIPVGLANLKNALELNLGNNSLTGTIPPQFGGLTNLQYLRLHQNNLTGPIPPELGQLQNLLYLILYNNQLNGTIPPELTNCSAMQNTRLSNNWLTGTLTDFDFLRLENLTSFSVNGNNLTGGFPETIFNCKKLELLDLSRNNFSGGLPHYSVYQTPMVALRVLELSNNLFSGSIPSWIWHLEKLQVLVIYNNSFTGSLPSDLTGLVSFYTRNLYRDNSLQTPDGGPVKVVPGGGFFEQVELRVKTQNTLAYEYILDTLIALDLSLNQLSGDLPEALGTLLLLVSLSVAGNNFSGEIKASLGDLNLLQLLDLSENNLVGQIPLELTNLNLGYLNLSYNSLQGIIPTANAFSTRFAENAFKPGNDALCGAPVETACNSTNLPTSPQASSLFKFFDGTFMKAFEIGLSIGIVLVASLLTLIPYFRSKFLTAPPRSHKLSVSERFTYGFYKEPA